jgi:putative holliday junction resolvase
MHTPLPSTGRLLAVDWGEIRIGLALSDESQVLASPLDTLVRRAGKRLPMARLLELTTEWEPVGVVVGLPLSGEGAEEKSAAAAREMADTIGRRTGLPLEMWDERMSTARALGAIREQGGSTRGRKGDVDALAAAVLLQHFLDARREQRERAEPLPATS